MDVIFDLMDWRELAELMRSRGRKLSESGGLTGGEIAWIIIGVVFAVIAVGMVYYLGTRPASDKEKRAMGVRVSATYNFPLQTTIGMPPEEEGEDAEPLGEQFTLRGSQGLKILAGVCVLAQIGVPIGLSTLVGSTMVELGRTLGLIGIVVATYALVDMAFVFTVEYWWILKPLYKAYGRKTPGLVRFPLLFVFFFMAGIANAVAVVLPVLDGHDGDANLFARAFYRGWFFGWFSYGNLALVQAWQSTTFPLELVAIQPVSGAFFSGISSAVAASVGKLWLDG